MKYLRKSIPARRRLRVPLLRGGLDAARGPAEVADDALTSCTNLWWRQGALRTRPALRTAFTVAAAGVDASQTRIFRTGDGERVYVLCAPAIRVLARDGQLLEIPWPAGLDAGMDGFFAEEGGTGADADAGVLLFLNNGNILRTERDGLFVPVEQTAYEPLVLINGRPGGVNQTGSDSSGGDLFEGFNLLTRFYRARYTSD
jgi:hypothetical protein